MTIQHPQLERLLNLAIRSLELVGAQIVVGGQVLVSSGSFPDEEALAELGLFDADYSERGLLKVYCTRRIEGRTLSTHEQLCLEDFAALASELLALESPQSLEEVYVLAPVAMLVLDARGKIQSLNRAGEQLWRCSASELQGHRAEELLANSADAKRMLLVTLLLGQTVRDFACTSATLGGTPLTLNLNITPIMDAGGHILRFVCCVEEVSEQRRIKAELQAQKQFYENILDNIPAEIAVLDKDLRYLYINPKAIRSLELRMWALGKNDAEIVARAGWSVEGLHERREKLEGLVQDKVPQTWEEAFELNGGWVYRQRYANPVFDASGELDFIVGYSADITALKLRKQAQKQALEEYKSLFERASLGLFRTDPHGVLLAANPALVRLSGYPSAEAYLHAVNVEGRTVFVSPAHRQNVAQTLLAGGEVKEWRTQILPLNSSSPRWVSESAHAVRSESGEVLYYEGTARDMHDEMQALERLKLIERAVESSSDAITLYDSSFKPLYHNPAAMLTFGRNLDEYIQDWEGVLEPGRMSAILEYLETHLTWSGELEVRHREGRPIPCQVRIDTILGEPDASGVAPRLGTLSVATDVSLHREVERFKDAFITTVSHELRTPLTSLRGALGLLAGDDWGAPSSAARDLIRIALSNTERLSRRISDILDIGKLERGDLFIRQDSLDLAFLLEQAALEMASHYAQRGVRLVLETAQTSTQIPALTADDSLETLRVRGDAERLLQVLIHLLDNAVKASNAGSLVVARVSREGRTALLEVIDGGVGVPSKFRPHIFRRFARADTSNTREHGGLGLGLAMSRIIAEMHGGAIGYRQREEGGSTFFLQFPLEAAGQEIMLGDLADLI